MKRLIFLLAVCFFSLISINITFGSENNFIENNTINNDKVRQTKLELLKQGIISKELLNKTIKGRKNISTIDLVVKKVSIQKLEKLILRLEKIDTSLFKYRRHKDMLDYLEAKVGIEIINRSNSKSELIGNIDNITEKDNSQVDNKNIENKKEYYIEKGKIYLNHGGKIIHITKNIKNIGEDCTGPGGSMSEAIEIIGFSDQYLLSTIYSGICEGGGGKLVYIFDLNTLKYISDSSILKYLENKFGGLPVYQYLNIDNNKLKINAYNYLLEPDLGYNFTITDSKKTIKKVIDSKNNTVEYIKTLEINLKDIFTR